MKDMANADRIKAINKNLIQELDEKYLLNAMQDPTAQANFLQTIVYNLKMGCNGYLPSYREQLRVIVSEITRDKPADQPTDCLVIGTSFLTMANNFLASLPLTTLTFVEASQALLDACRFVLEHEGARVAYIKQDATEFAQHELYDSAQLAYALPSYDDDDKAKIISNIYKSLKPGGLLILQDILESSTPQEAAITERLNNILFRPYGQSGQGIQEMMFLQTEEKTKKLLEGQQFEGVCTVYKCLEFSMIIARKPAHANS